MTFTITYAWWWIPTAVTVISLGWAIYKINTGKGGSFGAIFDFILLIPALFVSMLAWIVAAILK